MERGVARAFLGSCMGQGEPQGGFSTLCALTPASQRDFLSVDLLPLPTTHEHPRSTGPSAVFCGKCSRSPFIHLRLSEGSSLHLPRSPAVLPPACPRARVGLSSPHTAWGRQGSCQHRAPPRVSSSGSVLIPLGSEPCCAGCCRDRGQGSVPWAGVQALQHPVLLPMPVATSGEDDTFQAPLHLPTQQKASFLGGECRWWGKSLLLVLPQPDFTSFQFFSFSLSEMYGAKERGYAWYAGQG